MNGKKQFSTLKWSPMAEQEYKICQNKIIKLFHNSKTDRYLGIGCGDGQFTLECSMAAAAREVYGIEIDRELVGKARENGANASQLDANNKHPYPDNYFDVITANQVLEHVTDTDNVIREYYRVLNKNGLLILASPNLCSLLQRILIMSGNQPTTLHVSEMEVGNFIRGTETKFEHIHAFSPSALENLLKYHNFLVKEKFGSGFYPLKPPLSVWVSTLFPKLALYYIIKVSKMDN